MTEEEKQEIIEEYNAAMFASNEAGYAGITAEQTIRYLMERAEAAEAKLAELEKQEPVAEVNHDGTFYGFKALENMPEGNYQLFTRPALSSDLPDLSPINNCLAFFASAIKSGESWSSTCRRDYDAALSILRKLKENI